MQTKKMSGLESLANFIVAFTLGYATTYYAVPLIWGVESNISQPIGFVLLLNVLSTARHYIIRRVFNRFIKKVRN